MKTLRIILNFLLQVAALIVPILSKEKKPSKSANKKPPETSAETPPDTPSGKTASKP